MCKQCWFNMIYHFPYTNATTKGTNGGWITNTAKLPISEIVYMYSRYTILPHVDGRVHHMLSRVICVP